MKGLTARGSLRDPKDPLDELEVPALDQSILEGFGNLVNLSIVAYMELGVIRAVYGQEKGLVG